MDGEFVYYVYFHDVRMNGVLMLFSEDETVSVVSRLQSEGYTIDELKVY